ncbi:MAG: hypothetical protein ACKOAV_08035 [Bacteroidota bacterium]
MKKVALLLSAAALLALTNPVEAGGLFGKKKKSCSTEQAKCGGAKATTASASGDAKSGCASAKAEGKGCCSKKAATSTSSTAPTM